MYALLLVNFAQYVADDFRFASYTMRNGGTILKWMREFATTIDMSAWFVLLLLFELETYVWSDEMQERAYVVRLVHSIRLLCCLFLAHSVWAFGITYYDLTQLTAIPNVTDLCQLVEPDISFTRNLHYEDLTLANCTTLSSDSQFFFVEPALVVSDTSGYVLHTNLALGDIVEVIVWLFILLAIEITIRLQDREITRGRLMTTITIAKRFLYTILWLLAAYWLWLGHYHYTWDAALWILGFMIIGSNLEQWKDEIEQVGIE